MWTMKRKEVRKGKGLDGLLKVKLQAVGGTPPVITAGSNITFSSQFILTAVCRMDSREAKGGTSKIVRESTAPVWDSSGWIRALTTGKQGRNDHIGQAEETAEWKINGMRSLKKSEWILSKVQWNNSPRRAKEDLEELLKKWTREWPWTFQVKTT